MLGGMKRVIWLAFLVGCSSSPANVAGDYSFAVTNEADGCQIGWTVNMSNTGVQVTITQSGSSATAVVMGGSGFVLGVLLGTSTFTGTVDGDSMDLRAIGTAAKTMGNCTYTYDGEIAASISGDTITGHINYTTQTNNNTDCATLQNCKSFQKFTGARPPK